MFISSAFAQDAAAAQPSNSGSLLLMLLMASVFYFLLIRPQQKRFNEHKQMVSNLRRGDKVVTSGGIVGVITKVENDADIAHLEIADGVKVKVVRSTIASVMAKTGDAEESKSE